MQVELFHGDCFDILKTLPENSVDAIITDPPAGIAFMSKNWDKDKGGRDKWIEWMQEIAAECLRVIKPGGHALVWAIPRTSHWTGMAWENAKWECRDTIIHAFASGFPKNQNIALALDKREGKIGHRGKAFRTAGAGDRLDIQTANGITGMTYDKPISDAAKQWNGWGTALKPAVEIWWLFRKPLIGTVVENVLEYGTGGINIDESRIPCEKIKTVHGSVNEVYGDLTYSGGEQWESHQKGRFPANLCHDGSDELMQLFPEVGQGSGGKPYSYAGREYCNKKTSMFNGDKPQSLSNFNDSGSAARFFFCSKASRRDREEGCEGLPEKVLQAYGDFEGTEEHAPKQNVKARNVHPTVKPFKLMKYLCKLITPPNGTILDPFLGSGSTGKAAIIEGFNFIGIEQEKEYFEIAKARLEFAKKKRRKRNRKFFSELE